MDMRPCAHAQSREEFYLRLRGHSSSIIPHEHAATTLKLRNRHSRLKQCFRQIVLFALKVVLIAQMADV